MWKVIPWNANNKYVFIFYKNMTEFPKRPVLSALAFFLESCVHPSALPCGHGSKGNQCRQANVHAACRAWIIIKSLPLTQESCVSCQHPWNSAHLSWWPVKRVTSQALCGSLQLWWHLQTGIFGWRHWVTWFSRCGHTLFFWTSSDLEHHFIMALIHPWTMVVTLWLPMLDIGLHVPLWGQWVLTFVRAGTPVPGTNSPVHHRLQFYLIT